MAQYAQIGVDINKELQEEIDYTQKEIADEQELLNASKSDADDTARLVRLQSQLNWLLERQKALQDELRQRTFVFVIFEWLLRW